MLYHLYTTEKSTAELILNSLEMESEKVDERDLSFLTDRSKRVEATIQLSANFITKIEGMELLEESRFQYLQTVFNETHEEIPVEKSMNHPAFGFISLKNVVDFIWMHEKRHIDQIEEIKRELGFE